MFEHKRNEDNPEFIKAMKGHYDKQFENALVEYQHELKLLKKLPPEMITHWRDGDPQTVADRIVDVGFFIGFEEDSMRAWKE